MRKVYLLFVAAALAAAAIALPYVLITTMTTTLAVSSQPGSSTESPGAGGFHAAAPEESSPSPADVLVAAKIAARINPSVFGTSYSINVVDATTNSVIFASNAGLPRLPASNMKLITAFTALKALGPGARATTRVVSLGNGHIAIIGAGDATLSQGALVALATRTRAAVLGQQLQVPGCTTDAGAACRAGISVHFVDTLFGPANRAPGWTKHYVPGVASNVSSLGVLGDYSPTPAADAARMFAKAMSTKSLRAKFDPGYVGDSGPVLASYTGDTVADQVAVMLARSENNVAEVLFRRVAIATGNPATWDGGVSAATALLAQSGLPMNELVIRDGSGLSRQNRASATFFTALLAKMVDAVSDPELASIYYGGGLPVAARTGTLASRFRTKFTKCAAGTVYAKTGNLNGVISLSGIAIGSDGRPKLFSVLINDSPADQSADEIRQGVDRVVTTMTGCR